MLFKDFWACKGMVKFGWHKKYIYPMDNETPQWEGLPTCLYALTEINFGKHVLLGEY